MNLQINFGALAPPLASQLSGFGLKNDVVLHLQKDADAITRCAIRGFIPEAVTKRARQRLFKKIVELVSDKK